METVLDRLPLWGLLLLGFVWVTWKELGPRLNRGRRSNPPGGEPSVSQADFDRLLKAMEAATQEAREDRKERYEQDQRLERILQQGAENDKRILETLDRMMIRDQHVTEILQEMRVAFRTLGATQETLLRRMLEDTGRFTPQRP